MKLTSPPVTPLKPDKWTDEQRKAPESRSCTGYMYNVVGSPLRSVKKVPNLSPPRHERHLDAGTQRAGIVIPRGKG